jgi:hypothetical protein
MLTPYVIALAVAKLALEDAADQKAKLQVLNFASGPDSQASTPQVLIARDPEGWHSIWNVHRRAMAFGASATVNAADEVVDMPMFKFDRQVILAVFGGNVSGVIGYAVIDAGTKSHRDYVNLRPVYGPPTGNFTLTMNPYAFVQLTKTNRALDVYMQTNPRAERVKIMSFPKVDAPK